MGVFNKFKDLMGFEEYDDEDRNGYRRRGGLRP